MFSYYHMKRWMVDLSADSDSSTQEHIAHSAPGLAELDYWAVVYSIIFCNGISVV